MNLDAFALVVSGFALVSSVGVAIRQIRLQRCANYTPLVLEFVCAFRSQKLYDDLVYVLKKLRSEHQPTAGISNLPETARSAVLNIAYYYQAFAWLDDAGAIDDKEILRISRQRAASIWQVIEPFVQAERATVPGPLLTKLEAHSQRLQPQLSA
jgi:hypothetical protein